MSEEIINHEEAFNLAKSIAYTGHQKSNLARCYLELKQQLEAAERRLAEQQAAAYTVLAILAGVENDAAVKAYSHIKKHFAGKSGDIDKLLAQAKQQGIDETERKYAEMVPVAWMNKNNGYIRSNQLKSFTDALIRRPNIAKKEGEK